MRLLLVNDVGNDDVTIGFSETEGRIAKWNQQTIRSYKDILTHFKVVTLAAEDLELVQGGPAVRREFLDYALLLHDPTLIALFKTFRQVLDQRNSMLAARVKAADDAFMIWTEKLWQMSRQIQAYRRAYLAQLESLVNHLLITYFVNDETSDFVVRFVYGAKHMDEAGNEPFQNFWARFQPHNGSLEWKLMRSLFGAHLDDFTIEFQRRRARAYASRGQQKLLALLIKIAQLQQLLTTGEQGILLLDDFITDFDRNKVMCSMAALKDLTFQMFVSCPIAPSFFLNELPSSQVCHIKL